VKTRREKTYHLFSSLPKERLGYDGDQKLSNLFIRKLLNPFVSNFEHHHPKSKTWDAMRYSWDFVHFAYY